MRKISMNWQASWISLIMDIGERFVRKYKQIILINCILLAISQSIFTQQLPLFSQYTFNAFLLNPAVAGAEGYTAINLTSRAQWIGVEGAPLTGNVSVQARIMRDAHKSKGSAKTRYIQAFRSGRVGVAGGFYFDRAGLIDQTSAFLTYAYHITTSESQFSMGASLTLLQFKVNTNLLNYTDRQNNITGKNKLLIYYPDVNLGAYFTNKEMFIGLSVLQLTQGAIHFQNYDDNKFVMYRHFYLTGGYKFEVNKQIELEPSFYVKTTEEWRMQMDASLKCIYDNRFWVSAAYRTEATYIASFGLKIERLYLGYAFDYSTKGMLNNSNGSHELMIALKLGDNSSRFRWLQRY